MAPPQLSEDRNWWWDGTRWWPAVTVEGRWRFDGVAWRQVGPRWGLAFGLLCSSILAFGLACLGVVGAMVLGLTEWGLSDEPTPGWVDPALQVTWIGAWLSALVAAALFLAALLALVLPRR